MHDVFSATVVSSVVGVGVPVAATLRMDAFTFENCAARITAEAACQLNERASVLGPGRSTLMRRRLLPPCPLPMLTPSLGCGRPEIILAGCGASPLGVGKVTTISLLCKRGRDGGAGSLAAEPAGTLPPMAGGICTSLESTGPPRRSY